jgi:hypothetical protein
MKEERLRTAQISRQIGGIDPKIGAKSGCAGAALIHYRDLSGGGGENK